MLNVFQKFLDFLKSIFNPNQDVSIIAEIEKQIESAVTTTHIEESSMNKEPFKINVSEGQDNYSQRKSKLNHKQIGQYGTNTINWTCVCNVHAIAMALLYSGWIFPKSDYSREPDALGDFIIKECLKDGNWFKTKMYNLWHNWFEGDPKAYTPLELHEVLAHYTNEYMKCTSCDTFTTVADLRDVFKHIYENHVVVPTSVQWGGLKGHIIAIVGFTATCEQDLINWLNKDTEECPIQSVYYDDPWGCLDPNTNTYDGTKSGNDNCVSFEFLLAHWKDVSNRSKKYAHFILKPATCA